VKRSTAWPPWSQPAHLFGFPNNSAQPYVDSLLKWTIDDGLPGIGANVMHEKPKDFIRCHRTRALVGKQENYTLNGYQPMAAQLPAE